jgi:hypothetical protein
VNRRSRALTLLAVGTVLLAGCASSHSGTAPAAAGAPRSPQMTPGMVMPDGSTMGAAKPSEVAAADNSDSPSAAEKMICAAETHSTITKVLGLKAAPTSRSSWRDHVYTCTYRLPMGTLIVSVKQSAGPAAAETYFREHQATLGATEKLDGLGQGSYGTKSGTVVLLKDNDTLTVDATRLPAVFGDEQSKRFDFAYELASDILGCWTEG